MEKGVVLSRNLSRRFWKISAIVTLLIWYFPGSWLARQPFVFNTADRIYTWEHLLVEVIILIVAMSFILESIYHLYLRPVPCPPGNSLWQFAGPRLIRLFIGVGIATAHILVLCVGGYR